MKSYIQTTPVLEVLELVQYKDKTTKKKKLTINKSKIAT